MRVHLLDLDDVYKALSEAQHYDALWNRFIEFLTASDVDLISYHHLTPYNSAEDDRIDTLTHGYPRAWQTHYFDNHLYRHDPIYNMSYKLLRPMKWSDITKQEDLTSEQRSFVAELNEWMKGDGYVIPAFGPSGKNASFGLGNTATISDWDNAALRRLEWICLQFHIFYSVLRLKEFQSNISLTDQDRDILQKWGHGTNVAAIGDDIGKDRKAVETVLKTIMKKLNVTDSTSLMIRASQLGLIKSKI